jgi:uncharacterized protein involved in type VI secretion and phage assembly
MNPPQSSIEPRLPSGPGGRWYGLFPALVTDLRDPEGMGRVKVKLPRLPDSSIAPSEAWARLATLMAGNHRGSWFVPDVDDEVLVCFEAGDPRLPCVLGGLWNRQSPPPESMDAAGANNKKVLRSRNGVKLTLDDQNGQETFIVETPGGQRITLHDGPGAVEVVDSNGNSVKLESTGITITAAAKVTIRASEVAISAGMVQVDAGMSKFSGVIKCDTLISNSVVSASYSPGAGNVM